VAPATRTREAARRWLALGLVLLLAACQPSAAPTRTVTGILIGVDSSGLSQLSGFTLRDADGTVYDFTPAPTFNQGVEHVMSPGHMRAHMALAVPVTVTYQTAPDGSLTALSAVDAADTPTPPAA
jgi:hypothetical protein